MGKDENIEINRIIDILKSKKILIAFILSLFIVLGYFYSYYYIKPEYKSTTTLLLIPNNSEESKTITNSDLTLNSGLISTYSNIAKNSKVLKKVIDNLNLEIAEAELLKSIEISIVKDTHILEISVKGSNAEVATDITKELANVFLAEIKEIYQLDNIGIVDEAQIPNAPYNISHPKDIVIFIMIGAFASFIYVMIVYIFDNTIKKDIDIERYIKVKALGNIPINVNKKNEIVERNNAKSYVTECINTIRTNILYMNSTKKAKTILITSCMPREGKSWVSANIAASFAETNRKVLIIDADMRKGRANKIFGIDNTEGLSNYLHFITGNIKEDIELGRKYIKETQIPNLHILSNGPIPPNPSELLASSGMKELVTLLKNIYDIIIIDAPPCKLVSDSIVLSTIVDSTVLVVNAEKTKISDLKEVKKSINIVGGKIIGAILNRIKVSGKTYSKSYYYGHSNKEHGYEMKEKRIITVNEIIDRAMPALRTKDFNIFFDEEIRNNKYSEEQNISNYKNENDHSMDRLIKKQDKYLEKVANTVSDIKVQLNTNMFQDKLKSKKSEDYVEEAIAKKIEELQQKNNEELKKEIKNITNTEELNKISEQLEKVKANYETVLEQMKNTNTNEQLVEELAEKNLSLSKEQIREILREEIEKIKEINNEDNLNKARNTTYVDEISNQYNMEEIYEKIEDVRLNYGNLIKEIVNSNNERMEEMQEENQKLLQQQLSNINYTEQINHMNEMISNLKDSYLELSNIVRTTGNGEQQINNENVIDLKTLKKQKEEQIQNQTQRLTRQLGKRVFSIEEDISYEDLEKTAVCVIPIDKKDTSNLAEVTYENMI